MRLQISVAASLALLAITMSACRDESPESRKEPAAAGYLETAQWSSVPQSFAYSGTVRGTRRSQLGTKVMGRISYLRVDEGERVRSGQTLVRIQSENVAAQRDQVIASLKEADAALGNARLDYERMEALLRTESATQKEFDDARAHYEMSEARLSALQARLSEVNDVLGYSTITAPMHGTVVMKHADEGDMASPGIPLLTVEDTSELEVVARVPESDIDLFAVDDTVTIRAGALDGIASRGVVTRINPSGDSATRQFEIQVALQHSDHTATVKSGMFARVELLKEGRRVITVPTAALRQRGQLTGLFTVDSENRALLRWVRTGKQYGDRVEILSGLTEGEAYVTSHEGRLDDGERIRIMN